MKNNITLIFILIFVVFIALYLGATVASGNIVELTGWFGATLLILYLVKGYQLSWQTILFIVLGNISFMHSFRIDPVHASAVIFVLFIISCLLRNVRLPSRVPLRGVGMIGLNVSIVIFLVYGIFHLTLSRIFPHIPGEFSLGNSAKGYFKAFFPLAILLFGLNSQIGFQVRRNWVKLFLIVMWVGVVFNVGYLLYLYLNGFSAVHNSAGFDEIGVLHIPLINALPHHFAMRSLGPLAVLFGFAFFTTPGWWRDQSTLIKFVTLCIIFGGLAGAVMSGGRAAVAMCLLFLVAISFYRKKIIYVISAVMGVILIVVVANLFSGFINDKAPLFVSRPLQYLMIEKGKSMDTIDHSQDQRNSLFDAALDEWRSDSRITLIGRGIYRYKHDFEELRAVLGEEGAFVEINLRAGTCHALIPSALVQYGIIGLILYLFIWIFLLRFNWKLYKLLKRERFSQELQTIVACLFIYNSPQIFIDLIGAGWMSFFTVIIFILARSRMSYELAHHLNKESGGDSRSQIAGQNRVVQNGPILVGSASR